MRTRILIDRGARSILSGVLGAALLIGVLLPTQPAAAQDLFCEYDPSILVQTDAGPVLLHLFFRTSRVIDPRVVEGLNGDARPLAGLTAQGIRERGVAVADRDALLRYLEAHTWFRVARVERRGSNYDIEIQSYVAGPLRLELTAYLAFDREDPTPTTGLKPISAPSPFLQQNPWIQPAPGFRPDVFSNFDTKRAPSLMTTTIRLSERDIRAQQKSIQALAKR
ncbi:MAG: hypothetical protein RMM58_07690 [Chloroflexota bacterium]|nr:hypothetical protein [Dehalococcoidia bacterium]MDW8253743.1 hypothetical protein [Chloroflexota bacterium]